MATETDLRLRSWLDSNQRDREQMCRAVLALDQKYVDVRPRHPSGGPDGGRDIEAMYNTRVAYGAVGFANGANDSDAQKKSIRKKFTNDLNSALASKEDLKVFVFTTNVHFTMGEQDSMKSAAKKKGIELCEIIDRERLRIELDSPPGYFVRFQYLGIPLSEAEQASFLSKYGSQIQEVVTTGFNRIEKTLNRLLFLNESQDVLDTLTVRFILDKVYDASEIDHFRSFIYLSLRAVRCEIFSIWFGSSDKSDRFVTDTSTPKDREPGIAHGIGTGQWEWRVSDADADEDSRNSQSDETSGDEEEEDDDNESFVQAGWSSGIGINPVRAVSAVYRHDRSFVRTKPCFSVRDLDDCSFLPFLSANLASKVHSFQVYANGYKLADYGPEDFSIDRSACGKDLPGEYTESELADQWVRLRPSGISSAHHLSFSVTTPVRTFGHEEPVETPLPWAI